MLGTELSSMSEFAKMTAASQAERTVLVSDSFHLCLNTWTRCITDMRSRYIFIMNNHIFSCRFQLRCSCVCHCFTLQDRAWCNFPAQLQKGL